MRDFKRLRQDPPQGVNGSPNPDNIMQWNAVIFGPEDTPWDGGARDDATAAVGKQMRARRCVVRAAKAVQNTHPCVVCPPPPPLQPHTHTHTYLPLKNTPAPGRHIQADA